MNLTYSLRVETILRQIDENIERTFIESHPYDTITKALKKKLQEDRTLKTEISDFITMYLEGYEQHTLNEMVENGLDFEDMITSLDNIIKD